MKFLVCFSVGLTLGTLLGCAVKPATTAAADRDFCEARATYKLAAIAANGALDPAPGSPRAKLEAAEDRFCADGGS